MNAFYDYATFSSSAFTFIFCLIGMAMSLLLFAFMGPYLLYKIKVKGDSFQNIFDNIVLLFYSTFDTFINFIKGEINIENIINNIHKINKLFFNNVSLIIFLYDIQPNVISADNINAL